MNHTEPANSFVGDFPAQQLSLLCDQNSRAADRLLTSYLATHKEPNTYLARVWKAIILYRLDESEKASPLFEQSLPLHDVSNWAKCCAASCFNQVEEPQKALQILKTIPRERYDSFFYLTRGTAYGALHMTDLAVADCLAQAKFDAAARTNLLCGAAELYYRDKRYKEALAVINQALPGAGKDNRYTLMQGYCLVGLKRDQEAVTSFSAAIEAAKKKNPENNPTSGFTLFRAYEERAGCYDRLGQADLARADRKIARDLSKNLQKDLIGR
ncbi:MAG: hypothetical protein JSS86_04850 [Cyanobacteria bacterium SZAS LIN-2]|nr:hypothetical protein [Cyanobacteria bacterium SZAS LIN-2]